MKKIIHLLVCVEVGKKKINPKLSSLDEDVFVLFSILKCVTQEEHH